MENVILIVLLLLAVALIAMVLLQRSEGGGLGMGGGGGGGGGVQARGQGNAMTRITWILGAAFMVAALSLTLISAQQSGSGSVLDGADGSLLPPVTVPGGDTGESLLPPSLDSEEPLLPVAE
ncbi:MAG: preprotein translocase subunit SecG [Pseudomonadota bacterium]